MTTPANPTRADWERRRKAAQALRRAADEAEGHCEEAIEPFDTPELKATAEDSVNAQFERLWQYYCANIEHYFDSEH